MQRSPHRPIFNNTRRRGTINTGAAIGEPYVPPLFVTINQASGQVDPAHSAPIVFDVVFSEAVTGFTTGDVSLTGTAGGTLVGTVVNSGDDINFTVVVSGMTSDGTVIASIPATVCTAISDGRFNQASTSTDDTVTWTQSIGWRVQVGANVDGVALTGLTGRTAQAGDVAIAFFLMGSSVPTPSGWTLLASDVSSFDFAYVYGKVLDGSETFVGGSSQTGLNMVGVVVFDGSIWGGWESAQAWAETSSTTQNFTAPALTASGADSTFVQAAFLPSNGGRTSFGYTGPRWAAIALNINPGSPGTVDNYGIVMNSETPGGDPSLTWTVTGDTPDWRAAGFVVTP